MHAVIGADVAAGAEVAPYGVVPEPARPRARRR
jgi:hypothetical protein